MIGYWYRSIGHGAAELPTQALPTKKKNRKWKEATMDALERIGIKHCYDNMPLKDYYRMISGDLSHQEISEVMPQLREVGDMLDKADIPPYIKHYDLIGVVVNALVGEFMQNGDSYRVDDIGEVATNEFLRDKREMLEGYMKERLENELRRRMIALGMNPDPENLDIEDPQQKEAYLQQLNQLKESKTPAEIERHMRMDWRTLGAKWGQNTYIRDRKRFRLDELERDCMLDFLLTGRCFTHYRLGYDYYEPERWDPINTFYSRDVDTQYPQEGEYVGRVHYYTPSQFVNKYGHKLTKKQKDKLLQGSTWGTRGFDETTRSAKELMRDGLHDRHLVPHHNHYEHEFLVGLQDTLDIPLGMETIRDANGNEVSHPRYLESLYQNHHRRFGLAETLRDDLELRTDLICVTEAYWVSYKKVGYVTYTTASGRVAEDIVTDEILSEFLRDNDIKQLNDVTLEELSKEYKENSIVWDYIPETWYGIKASFGDMSIGENIYLGMEPTEFQIRGNSNTYKVQLPVAGIVHQSLAKKLLPDQACYNIVRNQLYNFLEKEIGLFFIFDINFLPSEFREWGDTEETLMHLKTLARDVGLFPLDASRGNIGSAGGFNQFAPQNLSLSSQMADRMQLSEFFKARMFEQVGFNPQRLGTPVKYETATGVVQSQNASYAQTEIYFERFSSFKQRSLEMHLAVAQYAQKEVKDITIHYTNSDVEQSFLQFSDPDFHLRHLGVVPTSNAKKRKDMEAFKSYLLSTNTLGSDELDLAELFSGDSMAELIHMARGARLRRERQQAAAQEHELRTLQQQSDSLEKLEMDKWERMEQSKERDRQNRLDVKRIEALGRASDSNADPRMLDAINKEADLALRKSKQDADVEQRKREADRKEEEMKSNHEFKMAELRLKIAELRQRMRRTDVDKYIAEINKN